MIRTLLKLLQKLLRPALYTAFGGLTALVIIGVMYLNNKPDLSVWHTAFLDQEFTEDSDIDSFEAYLKLEDALFQELDSEIYDKIADAEKTVVNRYNRGSKADPGTWPQNWNRSFEWAADDPPFGVLLLHGLSDSPYSMRSLGKQMHADGAYTIGLRIPGHGTAPSGLRRTTFEDMAAAVALSMKHLRKTLGDDKPIYIFGYSNGGALALHYANSAIMDTSLPKPAGLVLFSPEIGIAPAAALAPVQGWIGEWLGLKKLAWNSVGAEFDPYKYNSFALNAGVLAYHATQVLEEQLKDLVESEQIDQMPPILAFQSAADATVRAVDLVQQLFDKLRPGGHELVIFDVNRVYDAQGLLSKQLPVEPVTTGKARAYTVSVVTNKTPGTFNTVLQERPEGADTVTTTDLDAKWPLDVYSLSHIALPFAPDDLLYGSGRLDHKAVQDYRIGSIALHGERKTLTVPISTLTRQHWNPFFSVLMKKTQAFVAQ